MATDRTTALLREARDGVLDRIAGACARAGRDPAEITLVAVTKTVDPARLEAAQAVGITVFGENRVQEAAAKASVVSGATWHLVGPLQANKARRALELFDVIQTVDSIALAGRLDGILERTARAAAYPVMLQVNVDRDPAKAGFDPDGLEAAVDALAALERIEVRGLMTVGRLVERAELARPTFAALRHLSARLRARWPGLGAGLSMGMSDDFEVAVEEGSTVVRVGRALFGDRP